MFSTQWLFLTWHDNKGSLGLHGNQARAEDAGSVGGGDAAHSTHFLETAAQRLKVPPAQQNAPVWNVRRGATGVSQCPEYLIFGF